MLIKLILSIFATIGSAILLFSDAYYLSIIFNQKEKFVDFVRPYLPKQIRQIRIEVLLIRLLIISFILFLISGTIVDNNSVYDIIMIVSVVIPSISMFKR